MNDSREEPKCIGEINFEDYLNEDSIGDLNLGKSIGSCKVYVYSNEGTIPHFHLFNKDKSFECCICIYEPLYFNHGFKTGILNSKQCRILNEWLEQPNIHMNKITNWELIDTLWRTGNGIKYCKKSATKPFYTNMTNMRG